MFPFNIPIRHTSFPQNNTQPNSSCLLEKALAFLKCQESKLHQLHIHFQLTTTFFRKNSMDFLNCELKESVFLQVCVAVSLWHILHHMKDSTGYISPQDMQFITQVKSPPTIPKSQFCLKEVCVIYWHTQHYLCRFILILKNICITLNPYNENEKVWSKLMACGISTACLTHFPVTPI